MPNFKTVIAMQAPRCIGAILLALLQLPHIVRVLKL